MLRFFLLFAVITVTLFGLYVVEPVQIHFVTPFTAGIAKVCSWLTQLFDPDVISRGKILQSRANGWAVSIEPGCNGIEALIILFAAIFAFPAPFKHKVIGFVIGFFAIQGLNLVRITSLFYLGQWNKTWFDWFHLYLWQALIILDALVVWLIWLRTLPVPGKGNDDTPPPTDTDDSDTQHVAG